RRRAGERLSQLLARGREALHPWPVGAEDPAKQQELERAPRAGRGGPEHAYLPRREVGWVGEQGRSGERGERGAVEEEEQAEDEQRLAGHLGSAREPRTHVRDARGAAADAGRRGKGPRHLAAGATEGQLSGPRALAGLAGRFTWALGRWTRRN